MTIIGGILAFLFLDAPWRYIVIGALLATDAFEIMIWLRWRKKRSVTGPEGLIGSRGKAVTDCAPDGQVQVKGQLWQAHCAQGVRAHEDVEVIGVEGLKLEVSAV